MELLDTQVLLATGGGTGGEEEARNPDTPFKLRRLECPATPFGQLKIPDQDLVLAIIPRVVAVYFRGKARFLLTTSLVSQLEGKEASQHEQQSEPEDNELIHDQAPGRSPRRVPGSRLMVRRAGVLLGGLLRGLHLTTIGGSPVPPL